MGGRDVNGIRPLSEHRPHGLFAPQAPHGPAGRLRWRNGMDSCPLCASPVLCRGNFGFAPPAAQLLLQPPPHGLAADLDSDQSQAADQRFGRLAGLAQPQQFLAMRFQLRGRMVARVPRLGDSLGERGGSRRSERGMDG